MHHFGRELPTPIYERLHEELLKREVFHADETTCQVLREEGKTAQSTSYMWIYTSGTDGLPRIVMCEYQPGRGGMYPQEFLSGFHGLLQCDGYQGYNKVADVLLACCMAHCRRKFFEALPAEKKKTLKLLDINSPEAIKEPEIPQSDLDKYIPAEIGVAYCNKLFYLEREFKELSADERKTKRIEQEVPIWDKFFNWIESLNPTKSSKLDKAVNYVQNHRIVYAHIFRMADVSFLTTQPNEWQSLMQSEERLLFFMHQLVEQMPVPSSIVS